VSNYGLSPKVAIVTGAGRGIGRAREAESATAVVALSAENFGGLDLPVNGAAIAYKATPARAGGAVVNQSSAADLYSGCWAEGPIFNDGGGEVMRP